jgi:hypothetical protein
MPTAITKPVLPPLQTPKTASFPSEIVETPLSACLSAVIKQEEIGLNTPITPPVAYMDFLKALTPIAASPPPSALSRSLSDESTQTVQSATSTTSSFTSKSDGHKSPGGSLPPTPFRRTPSHLRRLRIPHSPAFTNSATSGPSPRTLSSIPTSSIIYSPYSPADWSLDSATRKHFDPPRSACSKPVSVRSVVTRTVTYKRSPPLDPAPKGKRRKLDDGSMKPPPSPATTTTPPIVSATS